MGKELWVTPEHKAMSLGVKHISLLLRLGPAASEVELSIAASS